MKRHSPACERNQAPILNVLREVLAPTARVLEIASGTGQHAVHCAAALPGVTWQPTDYDADGRASVNAWLADTKLTNVRAPVAADMLQADWEAALADFAPTAIFCANMIHIAPWEAALGLLRGAGKLLPPRGVLILYGPFLRATQPTAPSNADFDGDLRRRDPRWGIRKLEDVDAQASAVGLERETIVEMPANNLTVVWRKRG